jgi:hypothetical protein
MIFPGTLVNFLAFASGLVEFASDDAGRTRGSSSKPWKKDRDATGDDFNNDVRHITMP